MWIDVAALDAQPVGLQDVPRRAKMENIGAFYNYLLDFYRISRNLGTLDGNDLL